MKRFFTHFKISSFSLVAAFVLLVGQQSWGQTTIALQDFETSPATPTLTFTNTNGGNSTGTNGSGGLPANANLFANGARGWQANNATSTLTFANQSLTCYTNCSFSFRLAGMSVNGTNGIDGADIVTVSVSVDGGTTYSSELTIAGSAANQRWDFTASGSATVTYDGNNSPTPSTSSSASGVSTVTINIPNGTSQVRLRIAMLNNDANERWIIDDVKLLGTSIGPSASILANGTGASTICTGSSANLKTTITGGTSPYTLVTSAGTTNSYASGENVSVSPTMTTPYTLTSVTDANGCASTGLSGTPTVTVTNTWNAVASTGFTTGSTWSCGVAPTSTADVTISGQNVTLSADATLNSITFASGGKLTLGANTLTVGTATGGTSEGWAITNGVGALKITNFMGAKTFPIGTLPAVYAPVIVNNSASARDFSARVGTTISGTPANVSKMVQLEWEVTPSNAVGNNAALTLQWPSAVENGSFVRGNAIEIAHYNGSAWDDFKLATLGGSDPYTATASGFTTFSPFVVANGTALSVDFLDVNVKKQGNGNVLTWKTASEKNNAYFDVQHSTTGRDFDNIGQVKGKGTSTVTNAYIFNHADPSVNTHYYRLRQVAVDGKETFSKVVSIVQSTSGKLNVYPTLANDKLTVSLDNPDVQLYSIFDLSGKAVQSGQIQGQKDLIINTLSVGTYILKVGSETVKFTKN